MFNIFKKNKKEPSNSPAKEEYLKAKEQFESANYPDALSTLIIGFRKDIYYKPLYELASECLLKLGGNEESILFKKTGKSLDFKSFKQLGSHFYNVEHYPLTRIFLEEAFKKSKDVEVANNLSIAYARRFETKKAQQTLEIVKDKFDFWTFWFYIKTKILNNDQKELEESIKQLENAFDPKSNDENIIIPKQKVLELREAYKRLLSIDKKEDSIRDWHYIQYGSVILDFFFDEDQYVAGGRYVAAWGNNHSIKQNLLLLSELLQTKTINKIIYANDRDSKIVGIILGIIMDKPSFGYDAHTIYTNCLLLAADSTNFNEFNNVEIINNNNITFAYNQNWLRSNFICADIIGLLSQTFIFPWNGGNYQMNEDGTSSKTDPDLRAEQIIAKEIYLTDVEEKSTIDPFYQHVQEHLKMNQNEGHRYNFMIESPIPGSYFGSN